MVIFFLSLLLVSVAGLASLIALKHWELTTGRVLFAANRPAAGRLARRVIFWVRRVLPSAAAWWAARAGRAALALMHRATAYSFLLAEQALERALRFIRHKTTNPPAVTGQASAFLREVAAHKRKIVRSTARRRLLDKQIQ